MSGAEVAIGLNSPPFFSLSGFRSQVSMWLGPPPIQSTIRLLLFLRSCCALASKAPASCIAGTAIAVVAMCPMKWRRDIPAGTIRRSDIGRNPRLASGARRPGTSPTGDAPSPIDLAIHHEFVGIQQSPEHVFHDADRVIIVGEVAAGRGQ